jgi:hypothetical protein
MNLEIPKAMQSMSLGGIEAFPLATAGILSMTACLGFLCFRFYNKVNRSLTREMHGHGSLRRILPHGALLFGCGCTLSPEFSA